MAEYGEYGDGGYTNYADGGGYDAGGGYGGGGFADQGSGGGYNGGGSQGKESPSKGRINSTATLTIRQVQSAIYDDSESKYVLANEPLAHCAILGEIVELEEKTNLLLLTLEDGTGRFECKQWNSSNNANDGEESAPSADHGLSVGMWVRVHVSLREFNKVQQATVRGVVKDPFQGNFDAITHHYLQCIYEHLGRTKGTLAKLKSGQTAAGVAKSSGVYGQPESFVAQRSQGVKVENTGGGGDLQSAVKGIFSLEAPDAHGWSIDGVMARLPGAGFGSATKDEVMAVVGFLCDDGQLYSTVDDNHFASTS